MDNTKTLIQGVDFTFDASAQTVTFAGFTPVQAQILVISNVTDNIIIYSSSQPATKGVLSGQVLTLTYDTTTMADSDNLQVRYATTDAQPISAAALPLPTDAATETKQDALIAKDFATQTTLAALLAKVLAAPSTEAKQDALNTLITSIIEENGTHDFIRVGGRDGGTNYVPFHVDAQGDLQIDVLTSALPTGASTAANQATIISAVDTLEALFATLNAKDFATQTTLAAVLAKIIAAPATEAKQDTLITSNAAIKTAVEIIDNAISGNEMQVDVITLPSLPAGTNNIGDVDVLSLPALAAGTNIIGQVNVAPQTSGGLTTYHLVSAASTNATSVKGSAGQVYGWFIYNSNAAARKVTFHNTAGTPTAGASVFFSIVIPASSGANVEFTNGIAFSSGIGITTVTGLADSDSTGVALNDLIINIFYK